ncbi:uncharacterized protein [Danio rerio]|uniref:Uncharacterized protein n=1 Tax=Danio rerio TaxID=7955 RepID=A0AC58HPA6_DANRE
MFTIFFILLPGFAQSNEINQFPPDLMGHLTESVLLSCSHSIQNFELTLWYKQSEDRRLIFLGYLNLKFQYPEDEFKNKIALKGDGSSNSTLTINNLTSDDSAVYFCAARRHGQSLCDKIHQSPPEMLIISDQPVTLTSAHTIQSYYMILWWCCFATLPQKKQKEGHLACERGIVQQIQATLFICSQLLLLYKHLTMIRNQFLYSYLFCWHFGCSLFSSVEQTPALLIVRSGESCNISCSHGITSYNTILWYYQHEDGQGMHSIGYSFHSSHTLENVEDKRYELNGDGKSSVTLIISKLLLNDSAVYFCAASAHSAEGLPKAIQKAHNLSCISLKRSSQAGLHKRRLR